MNPGTLWVNYCAGVDYKITNDKCYVYIHGRIIGHMKAYVIPFYHTWPNDVLDIEEELCKINDQSDSNLPHCNSSNFRILVLRSSDTPSISNSPRASRTSLIITDVDCSCSVSTEVQLMQVYLKLSSKFIQHSISKNILHHVHMSKRCIADSMHIQRRVN